MIAAIGAACRMMNTGRLNHSMVRDSPMPMPKVMPATAHKAMPRSSGCAVMRYALPRLPSRSISMRPRNVLLNGGNAGLTGQRPASSHSPKNRAKEASCQRRNLLQLRERRLQRREVPEVLELRVRFLDRARQGVELEVAFRRVLAAAVVREDAAGDAFLEVRRDLVVQLGGQILEQAELLAHRHHRVRILVDLAVDA